MKPGLLWDDANEHEPYTVDDIFDEAPEELPKLVDNVREAIQRSSERNMKFAAHYLDLLNDTEEVGELSKCQASHKGKCVKYLKKYSFYLNWRKLQRILVSLLEKVRTARHRLPFLSCFNMYLFICVVKKS